MTAVLSYSVSFFVIAYKKPPETNGEFPMPFLESFVDVQGAAIFNCPSDFHRIAF